MAKRSNEAKSQPLQLVWLGAKRLAGRIGPDGENGSGHCFACLDGFEGLCPKHREAIRKLAGKSYELLLADSERRAETEWRHFERALRAHDDGVISPVSDWGVNETGPRL